MVPGIGNSVFGEGVKTHGRKFGQGKEKKIPCFRCLTLRVVLVLRVEIDIFGKSIQEM